VRTQALSRDSDPLLAFCQTVTERLVKWPPGEDVLAAEFVSFFGITAFAHFETLSQLCVQLGVSVSVCPMPGDLKGHNSWYNGSRAIAIAEHESFPGANEHTLLHELRELLEHSFIQLGFAVAVTHDDLEGRAERFACMVRSNLAQKMMLVWLEQSEHVERKWLRYGAYLFSILGGLALFVGCILLPVFEDQALEFRKQRLLNSQQSNPSH
jgi:hypothetical protein